MQAHIIADSLSLSFSNWSVFYFRRRAAHWPLTPMRPPGVQRGRKTRRRAPRYSSWDTSPEAPLTYESFIFTRDASDFHLWQVNEGLMRLVWGILAGGPYYLAALAQLTRYNSVVVVVALGTEPVIIFPFQPVCMYVCVCVFGERLHRARMITVEKSARGRKIPRGFVTATAAIVPLRWAAQVRVFSMRLIAIKRQFRFRHGPRALWKWGRRLI